MDPLPYLTSLPDLFQVWHSLGKGREGCEGLHLLPSPHLLLFTLFLKLCTPSTFFMPSIERVWQLVFTKLRRKAVNLQQRGGVESCLWRESVRFCPAVRRPATSSPCWNIFRLVSTGWLVAIMAPGSLHCCLFVSSPDTTLKKEITRRRPFSRFPEEVESRLLASCSLQLSRRAWQQLPSRGLVRLYSLAWREAKHCTVGLAVKPPVYKTLSGVKVRILFLTLCLNSTFATFLHCRIVANTALHQIAARAGAALATKKEIKLK